MTPRYTSSPPPQAVQPKPSCDPSQRFQTYGPVQGDPDGINWFDIAIIVFMVSVTGGALAFAGGLLS